MASSRAASPASRASRSATPTPTRPLKHNSFFFNAVSESSSEEEGAEILRPRGKMAARMQARASAEQESESEAEDNASPTRSTMPTEHGNDARSAANQNSHGDEEEEEDDVITTHPRKLVSRRERSSTPEIRPQAAASSPGLFVSPSKPQSPQAAVFQSDDDDLPSPAALTKNPRYLALVAKKRQERLAREAEEARKKAARREAAGHGADDFMSEDVDDDNITDDEGGRKLTQEVAGARPARKASKKALEEMHRETQRLTRSLQLAHEAKVRKKITKATLFERFNFKPEGTVAPATEAAPAATSSSRAPTPGSAHQSDAEMRDADTPPSSPPQVGKHATVAEAAPVLPRVSAQNEDEDNFPTLEEMVEAAAAQKKLDKGKGKATTIELEKMMQPMTAVSRKRNLRVKLPPIPAHTATVSLNLNDDDDDDLVVQPSRKSKLDAIFDRIPLNQAKEPRPLQHLRRLAHLDDPERKPAPPARAARNRVGGAQQQKQHEQAALTAGELHARLMQRARQQIRLERERQLELLRARGIVVQTAEEREKAAEEVDDMVARMRREAEDIMEREREAAKAERKKRREAGGDEDPLGWDDSEEEDEEYVEEEGEQGEEVELELSGSEEEGDDEDEDGEENGDAAAMLIDDAAESAGESEPEPEEALDEPAGPEDSDEEIVSTRQARRRPRKHVTILSDDEEDEGAPRVKATPRPKAHFPKSPSARDAESPSVPTSVLRSATKTFIPGLPVAGPAGLGLTQIFAGTMDDSQMGTAAADSPSQPRPTFDITAFPDSNFSQSAQEVAEDLILNSQPMPDTQQAETQGVQIRFSQSQMHGFDTFLQEGQGLTQASDLIEPTQDPGFHNFSPLRQRFVEAPVSTVDTVPVDRTQADAEQSDSPLVRRTGKLRRRADIVPVSPSRRQTSVSLEADEAMQELEADEFGFGTVPNTNAFAAMKATALKEKKRKEAFDKKKSKAREMIEEQAEESEDEYAGLGGADGEDSDDEDDQSVKEMIDDETKEDDGDERKLAAFHADHERAMDEKQVDKLFHDVTTGLLRRKRAGNWDDLSDSDDGGEARRRMKRRQFAKMQRALFADERISKVAENPRNQAFLRTIEDHGSDDEMDFIFAPPPAPAGSESQESQASAAGATQTVIPNSQPQPPRPAANPRRTKESRKPSSLEEIRESLSNLLEEPHTSSLIPATELGSSDDEAETRPPSSAGSNKENRNPRRSKPAAATAAVIDRINLKRNASTSSTSSKLAFAATTPNTASTSGTAVGNNNAGSSSSSSTFRVPTLLRRATTNSLLSTTSSTSTSSSSTTPGVTTNTSTGRAAAAAAGESTTKIKKPAGKRSGVSYLARETERRAAVAEVERRREARKWRGAGERGKVVGGLFSRGQFE